MPRTNRHPPAAASPEPNNARGIERRSALLRVATEEFLKRGYEGAVVADISARAGGSTATVYKYFGGKAGLFAAAVAQTHMDLEVSLDRHDFGHEPLEQGLHLFAQFYIESALSKKGAAFIRMVIAESVRFPELFETMRRGNRAMIDRLAAYLALRSGKEGFVFPEPWEAAENFVSTLRGRAMANGLPPLKLAETPDLSRFTGFAITAFCRAHRISDLQT